MTLVDLIFESVELMAAIHQFLDSHFGGFGENERMAVWVEVITHTAAVEMISDRPQPLTEFITA